MQVFVNSDIIMPRKPATVFKKYSISKRKETNDEHRIGSHGCGVRDSCRAVIYFCNHNAATISSITVDPSYLTVGPGEQVTVNVTTDPPEAAGDVSWTMKDDLLRHCVWHEQGGT